MIIEDRHEKLKTHLVGLFIVVIFLYSKSDAWGLRRRDYNGSSLSMELSLETEAVAKSPASVSSVGSDLFGLYLGLGSGKNNNGLEPPPIPSFTDALIPESVHPTLLKCVPGSGSRWASGLSPKLWQRDTWLEGDGDLDCASEADPLSETLSPQCPRDPPNLLLFFSSDVILNFRCSVSIILSFICFLVCFFGWWLSPPWRHVYITKLQSRWVVLNFKA